MLSETALSYLNVFTLIMFIVLAIVLAINVYLFNNLRHQGVVKSWEVNGAIIANLLILILAIVAFVLAMYYLIRRAE